MIQNSRSAERSCICVIRKTELTLGLAVFANDRTFTQFLSCRRTRAFKRRCSISLTRQSRSSDVVAYRAAAHVPLPEITMSNSVVGRRISRQIQRYHSLQGRSREAAWARVIGAGFGQVKRKNRPNCAFFCRPVEDRKPAPSPSLSATSVACCDASFKPVKTGLLQPRDTKQEAPLRCPGARRIGLQGVGDLHFEPGFIPSRQPNSGPGGDQMIAHRDQNGRARYQIDPSPTKAKVSKPASQPSNPLDSNAISPEPDKAESP